MLITKDILLTDFTLFKDDIISVTWLYFSVTQTARLEDSNQENVLELLTGLQMCSKIRFLM